MASYRYKLLKQVLTCARPGQPLTAAWLAKQGVSAQLAYHYIKAGWLTRLGHGWFMRTGDKPDLRLSLAALTGEFHVGGKTALAWYGYQHNLSHRPYTEVFTDGRLRLPEWLAARFPMRVRRRRIFDDPTLGVSPWEIPDLPVSEPERAVLEMLQGVPQHQSTEEAAHLVDSLFALRTDRMQALLVSCRSVKAVRLFLHYAKRSSLPVLHELDLTHVHTGSATPYVRHHASGTIKV